MCKNNKEVSEKMTNIFHEKLGCRLAPYAVTTNAQMVIVAGFKKPLWVMELFIGKQMHYAVLEPPRKGEPRFAYIYYSSLRPISVIDLGQTYEGDGYKGKIFTDKDGNIGVEWEELK